MDFGEDVDPSSWKRLVLRCPKTDGSWADVELLRPDWWLDEQQARTGRTVYVAVPECGIDGDGLIQAITPCPVIAPGPGRVVTGTFRHHSTHVVDLYIEGEAEPIGATANHPFWSEDRQEFVQAGDLRPREALRTRHGCTTTVLAISSHRALETVYNLEVQVDHTYFVSSRGILVHNGWLCPFGWRLPKNGTWLGKRGNSAFKPSNWRKLGLNADDVVPFKNGLPDFSQWVEEGNSFLVRELDGFHGADRAKILTHIAKQKGLAGAAEAARWLRKEGLVAHHAGQMAVQLVPKKLHRGVRHSGWASLLRGSVH